MHICLLWGWFSCEILVLFGDYLWFVSFFLGFGFPVWYVLLVLLELLSGCFGV